MLSGGSDKQPLAELRQLFEHYWQSRSAGLTDVVVRNYQMWRQKSGPAIKTGSVPLTRILAGSSEVINQAVEKTLWRGYTKGFMHPATISILQKTTDWEQKGYLYFGMPAPRYSRGDKMILFDLSDKTVGVIQIQETTRTPVKTPDGFHFAAYSVDWTIPQRRLTASRWQSFKSDGLLHRRDDVFREIRISPEKFARYVAILKTRSR